MGNWLPSPTHALQTRERICLGLIFVTALLLFGSLRTPDFNDYDGVQFAFAVRDGFDLRSHNPHPPGFPLYIMAAKGLFLLTGDALEALSWLSAIGGALALTWVWWLARLWWPERPAIAWLATGWLLVTPHFWLGAEKELSDVPTLALHIAAVACAWRGLWSWRWRLTATAAVAVGLGFRIQNMAGFIPPWGFLIALSAWTDPRRSSSQSHLQCAARRILLWGTVLAALCLIWFWGMVQATGGWSAYRIAMHEYTAFLSQFENTMGVTGGLNVGWWATRAALHANSFLMAALGFYMRQITDSIALILWVPGLLAFGIIAGVTWRARSVHALTAALWALPYFVSEVLLFQPSNVRYALPVIPPLILFASAGLVAWHLPRPAKLLIAAPLALWLVFISTWCVRILRTELSPLVASVHWVFSDEVDIPGWGSGLISVGGEASRAADYYYRHRTPEGTGGGIAGRLDGVYILAPNDDRPFDPERPLVVLREFQRSLLVHPKHSHLLVMMFQRGP